MDLHWVQGFTIKTEFSYNAFVIKANKAGLLSLANHLMNLAGDDRSAGCHIHLDDSGGLEADSVEFILEKIGD